MQGDPLVPHEIARIHLEPGEVLVVWLPRSATHRQAHEVRKVFEAALPHNPVVAVSEVVELLTVNTKPFDWGLDVPEPDD